MLRAALVVLLAAGNAAAEGSWWAGGQVWTSSAVALQTGLVLGASGEAQRRLTGPFFAGARLALGTTDEANATWRIEHRHIAATVSAGADAKLGVGRAWAQLGAGALVLWELARRHQYERLDDLNVPGVLRETWSLGPRLGADLGLEVRFWRGFALTLSGGPALTWQRIGGARRARWAVEGGLGVGRAF